MRGAISKVEVDWKERNGRLLTQDEREEIEREARENRGALVEAIDFIDLFLCRSEDVTVRVHLARVELLGADGFVDFVARAGRVPAVEWEGHEHEPSRHVAGVRVTGELEEGEVMDTARKVGRCLHFSDPNRL